MHLQQLDAYALLAELLLLGQVQAVLAAESARTSPPPGLPRPSA